jgi:hypothetical protein
VGGRGNDCQNRDILFGSLLKNRAKKRYPVTPRMRAGLRIPGDADQRSDLMAIAIPKSCRSRFRDDGDHCSDGKPITFRPSSEWRSASPESFY